MLFALESKYVIFEDKLMLGRQEQFSWSEAIKTFSCPGHQLVWIIVVAFTSRVN